MPHQPLPNAHRTAVISDEVTVPPDVKIGPYAVLEGPVTLGAGCVVGPHAHLIGPMTLGENNQIGTGAVLGATPQHLGYKGEPSDLIIGNGNVFREHVTVHRAMPLGVGPGTGVTRIGNRGLFMVGCHVAHDCVIGDDVILANSALLAGHVTLEDRVFLSGNTAVHQFCRIGRGAMIAGTSATTKDVPPFWIIQNFNDVRGLNVLGMRRAGVGPADRAAVRKAFRIMYYTRPGIPVSEALVRIEAELGGSPLVREIVTFIRGAKRGVSGPHRFGRSDDGDDELSAAA